MNRSKLFFGSVALLGLVGVAHAATKFFETDTNHTHIGFTASTVLFDVPGRFDSYKVQVSGDPDTLADAKVQIEIDTKSVATNNKTRDKHLQSPDFFDAAKYPKIVYTSSSVRKEGANVIVDGTLDMHGMKKPLKIAFTTVTSKNGAGIMETVYKAAIPLNRKDFGIGGESIAAKISLNDQVTLNLLLAGFFQEKPVK